MPPLRLVLMVICLIIPVSAQALDHQFVPPETVVADPDGEFYVELRVILGTGGGSLGHGYLEGLENCQSQLYADGFCILEREEGEIIVAGLYGSLDDPTAPGRVYVEVSICSDQDTNFWSTEVDVEPFTVPTQKESLGRLKTRY